MEPKLNDDDYEKKSEKKLTILNNIEIFLFLLKGKEKNFDFFYSLWNKLIILYTQKAETHIHDT